MDLNACYNLVKRIFEYPGSLADYFPGPGQAPIRCCRPPEYQRRRLLCSPFWSGDLWRWNHRCLVLCKSETMDTFLQFLRKESTNGFTRRRPGYRSANSIKDAWLPAPVSGATGSHHWSNKSSRPNTGGNFHNVTQVDQFHQTAHLMQMTKSFIIKIWEIKDRSIKTDQVHYLNKSMNISTPMNRWMSMISPTKYLMIRWFRSFAQFQSQPSCWKIRWEMEPVLMCLKKAVKIFREVFKSVLKLDKIFLSSTSIVIVPDWKGHGWRWQKIL